MPFPAHFTRRRETTRKRGKARPVAEPCRNDRYGVVMVVMFEYPENPPGLCARTW